MKYSFLSRLELDEEINIKVSRSLDRTMKGSSDELVSPIGQRSSPESILQAWDSIFKSKISTINKSLYEFEQSNRSKFGPRSIAKPWIDRKESLNNYFFSGKEAEIDYDILSELSFTKPIYKGRLRPISADNAVKFLRNSSNSGLPRMTRKSEAKLEMPEDLERQLQREYPCLLFTRTQEGGKTRDVWGYPMSDTIREMQFYQPLLSVQKNVEWRSALNGPDLVDMAIDKLMRGRKDVNNQFVSVDFSQYDASINLTLQKAAFRYISELFQRQYDDQITQDIANRFSTIEIITPDGIKSGYHGVPSGSTFTNEVDSIVQYLVSNTFFGHTGAMQIQGDDGVHCVGDPKVFLDHLESYGLDINSDKSMVSSTECTYLQRLYSPDYKMNTQLVGVYSTYRALNRIIHPERFVEFNELDIQGKDYHSIRTISILENCKHHPLFPELVEFIYKLDKYDLQYSTNGLNAYIERVKKTNDVEGVNTNQYESNVQGIANFETVRLLTKL